MTTADDVQKSLRRLTRTNVLLIVVVIALGAYVWNSARETTRSLCNVRGLYESEVARTNKALADHPGPKVFGIPRELIAQGRDGQERTIAALSNLDC